MGYEDVDVTLRLRAIDETDRVMADAARRAKSTTDAMVRGMSDVGKATLEVSRATQKLTEGLTSAGRAAQQFSSAASNVSAMTKAMGDYNISSDRMARGMSQAGQAAGQAAQATKGFQNAASATSAALSTATRGLLGYAAGFTSILGAMETTRRGFISFAESQRGMDRIRLDTQATTEQMEHLGKTIGALKSITGESGTALRQNFSAFREQTGLAFNDAEKLFNRIALASHAAGTNFEDMSRSAVAAITNFKVPQEEVSAMLDTWVKTIPSSMMSTFAQAAPRITQLLHGIGYSGKESAEGVASAFANLAVKLGNARLATSVLEDIFTKATDINSALGMQTVPMIQRVLGKPDEFKNSWEAIYKVVKQSGIFDTQDLAQKSMIRQMLGLDDRTIEAIKAQHDEIEKIDKVAKRLGLTYGEVDGRIKVLNGGAQRTLDTIAAATDKIYTAIGKLFNLTQIPNRFGETLAKDASDMERLVYWTEKLIKLLPGGDKPTGGGAAETTLGTPGKIIDPILDALGSTGQSKLDLIAPYLQQMGIPVPTSEQRAKNQAEFTAQKQKQEEEDRKKSARDAEIEAEIKKENDARAKIDAEDRAKKQAFPGRPLGKYATGGEFTVPGSGRGDDQPVSFMGTPGERVTVESIPAADTKESLQRQQDKADIALREHFARFHGKSRPGAQLGAGWPGDALGRGGGAGGQQTAALGGSPTSDTGSTGGGDGKTTTTTQDGTTPAGPPTSGPGYNIGPYGQPMPEWGTHVTEGEDWGGGTGGGVAGGVPGLPGGPSGRALTKEERAAGGAGATTGATGATGEGGQTGLAGDRAKFAKELAANPALREKVLQIANNEQGAHGQGTQAVIESMMNRASYAGRTLAQEARWRSQGGYYADGKKGSGMNRAVVEQSLANALGGGNVSNYATDNASTQWGLNRIKRDMYRMANTINKEYFSTPGLHPDGPGRGNYNKYQAWLARIKSDGGTTPAVAGAGTTGTGTGDMAKPEGGVLASPLTGTVISTLGDERKAYKGRSAGTHQGIDIAAPQGTPISAQLGGTVIRGPYTSKSAAGQAIVVRYDNGTEARIYHLSKFGAFDAAKNKTFKAGDVLGYVGKTGAGGEPLPGNTPPHAHIEYYDKNGRRLDPSQVLGIGTRGEGKQKKLVSGEVHGKPGTTTKVAGPATVAPAVPKPAVPKFVPGRTQGLPGSQSGPAVKRDKPDKPAAVVTPAPDVPDTAAPAVTKGQAAAGELAEGGIAAAGGEYWVGEEGPELIKMGGQSGRVTDAKRAQQALKELEDDDWENRKLEALERAGAATKARGYAEWESGQIPEGYGPGSGLPDRGEIEEKITGTDKYGLATGRKPDAPLGVVPRYPHRQDPRAGARFDPYTGDPAGEKINLEPVIRPRIQQMGPLSMRWTRQSERQRHTDISRDQARTAHTDQGFA